MIRSLQMGSRYGRIWGQYVSRPENHKDEARVMKHLERDHIRQWLADGSAVLLPVEISRRIKTYLEGLPWQVGGSGLDWKRIPGQRAELATMTEREQRDWFRSTALGMDPFVIFFYLG